MVAAVNPIETPRSQQESLIYCVRSGHADVWHDNANIASLGPGTLFGEGSFLFNRQHSASVLVPPNASTPLECWVIPATVFRQYVLTSENMVRMFAKYARNEDDVYMTMVRK